MHHLNYFLIVHCFSQLSRYSLDLLEIHNSSQIIIIEVENFEYTLLTLCVTQLIVYDLQELLVVNISVFWLEILDHLEDSFVPFVEPEFLKNFLYFYGVDLSRTVLIEEVESGFEFFEVILGEFLFDRDGDRLLLDGSSTTTFHLNESTVIILWFRVGMREWMNSSHSSLSIIFN